MDIAAILHEIDAEIEKLERIRTIVEGLLPTVPAKKIKAKRKKPVRDKEVVAEPNQIVPPPTLVVLPPRSKREYRPRQIAIVQQPRPLASAIPQRPVFVPRAVILDRTEVATEHAGFAPEALEAALRKSFLGVAS
jgi:hypothetical protein